MDAKGANMTKDLVECDRVSHVVIPIPRYDISADKSHPEPTREIDVGGDIGDVGCTAMSTT